MPKHKHPRRNEERPRKIDSPATAAPVAHPPAKNLTVLVVSVVLFAVWFVFLAIMAVRG